MRKGQREEAAVGGVEDAEAVEARLDFEVGADLAVDEDGVGVELGDPGAVGVGGDGVEELAVGGEVAIVEGEGNLDRSPLGRWRASSLASRTRTMPKRPA